MAEPTLTERVNAVLATLSDDIKSNKLDLPSPPDLLLKIRSLTASQNATAADIADLIKLDPNISARVIKVANCALFGSRFHVSNISSAISRLGLLRVQSLLIGLSIAQNIMQYKTIGLEAFFNKTWQQSNHVASISYVLALNKTKIDPEKALLAGMIHNIGALPLALRLNQINELRDNPKIFTIVADIVIPKLYTAAGKLIMDSWNFTPEISRVTLSHSQLKAESPGEINLSDVILVAHQLNQISNFADEEEIPVALIETNVFKKFWPDWSAAVAELVKVQTEVDKMKHDMTH